MQSPLRSKKTESFVPVSDLQRLADGWILDCRYRQLSAETIKNRRVFLSKFLWWLKEHGPERCGASEIKGFLAYISTGHLETEGRWGNARLAKPVRPRTVKDYYATLRTFFRWAVEEGYIEASPVEGVKAPVARADQIQPFTQEQVAALLLAAKEGRYAYRDEAILLFLLDTAVRSSELCSLRIEDLDLVGKRATVLGKGNKHRTVFISRATAKAINQSLRGRDVSPEDFVFGSERGEGMTRSGLQQLLSRLAAKAGIEAVRCSPHTFRHTAAVWFLRSGGQVFALKEMLGHTNLQMTMRYVAVAQADVQEQHRQFSPVLRLGTR